MRRLRPGGLLLTVVVAMGMVGTAGCGNDDGADVQQIEDGGTGSGSGSGSGSHAGSGSGSHTGSESGSAE